MSHQPIHQPQSQLSEAGINTTDPDAIRGSESRRKRLKRYLNGALPPSVSASIDVHLTPAIDTALIMPVSEDAVLESSSSPLDDASVQAQQLINQSDGDYLVVISSQPAPLSDLPCTTQLAADRYRQFGAATHELLHALKTANGAVADLIDDGVEDQYTDHVHELFNIVEDGAIENEAITGENFGPAIRDRLHILRKDITDTTDRIPDGKSLTYSWWDAVTSALYEYAIYSPPTGNLLYSLTNPNNQTVTFESDTDREAFFKVDQALRSLAVDVLTIRSANPDDVSDHHDKTASLARAKRLLSTWHDTLRPIIDQHSQPDQSGSDNAGGGDQSNGESQSDQSGRGGQDSESSDLNSDHNDQSTPGQDVLDRPSIGDEPDADAVDIDPSEHQQRPDTSESQPDSTSEQAHNSESSSQDQSEGPTPSPSDTETSPDQSPDSAPDDNTSESRSDQSGGSQADNDSDRGSDSADGTDAGDDSARTEDEPSSPDSPSPSTGRPSQSRLGEFASAGQDEDENDDTAEESDTEPARSEDEGSNSESSDENPVDADVTDGDDGADPDASEEQASQSDDSQDDPASGGKQADQRSNEETGSDGNDSPSQPSSPASAADQDDAGDQSDAESQPTPKHTEIAANGDSSPETESAEAKRAEADAEPPEFADDELERELGRLDTKLDQASTTTEGGPGSLDELSILPGITEDSEPTTEWDAIEQDAQSIADTLAKALSLDRQTNSRSGLTSGAYDTSQGYKLSYGDPSVFKRDLPGREKRYALVIILDRSYSMQRDGKIEAASQAVAQLAAAAESLDIDVAVIDFIRDDARLVKPFSVDTKFVGETLTESDVGGGTPLSDALELGTTLVQEQQYEPLIINITDDKPDDVDAVGSIVDNTLTPICSLTIATDKAHGNAPASAAQLEDKYARTTTVYDAANLTPKLDELASLLVGF
ncbi:von Willebrand factor type A domain-containing protein [Halorientalis persicus]|uniref:von Willebrand factor type A domain-containing protein n=1 Tax=Halorientalis persicus TaxID=1367881 RepID=A0A1H8MQT6_9EURY|nr:VWA domain-containing protein [Halorientalis persicus]SEO19594.1 von Willebrand factor type A domain-containing protein [Halorientalis persicus]